MKTNAISLLVAGTIACASQQANAFSQETHKRIVDFARKQCEFSQKQ